jgi:hypothetical protein
MLSLLSRLRPRPLSRPLPLSLPRCRTPRLGPTGGGAGEARLLSSRADWGGVDMTRPHTWYPLARAMKRRVICHVGPTNSGKTYAALQVVLLLAIVLVALLILLLVVVIAVVLVIVLVFIVLCCFCYHCHGHCYYYY